MSGLTNGTSYTFTVTATNAVGTSSVSSSSAPTVPAAVPNAPTGLSASGANGTNIIPEVWSAPANGGAAITDYKLRYSTDNATWTTTDTGSTTLGYSQTVPSTVTYYVQVAAVNVMGQGAWSASDVVYWSNTGSYQYFNGTYTYSCLTGGTLSGTTCNIAEVYYAATQNANSGWTCPSGWGPATGSSLCSRTTGGTRANCLNNGGSWNANTSVCTLFTSGSYGPNGPDFGYYYTCLSGGSLSGSICITVYPSSYGATATPNYSTGYYYAFRG